MFGPMGGWEMGEEHEFPAINVSCDRDAGDARIGHSKLRRRKAQEPA